MYKFKICFCPCLINSGSLVADSKSKQEFLIMGEFDESKTFSYAIKESMNKNI